MIELQVKEGFSDFRTLARQAFAARIAPEEINWEEPGTNRLSFGTDELPKPDLPTPPEAKVSREFVELAKTVACHADISKWSLLYRLLWRLNHEQRQLLQNAADPDVNKALAMAQAVRFDAHKMKAYVRFRKYQTTGGDDFYLAWHTPEHNVIRRTAPFFARRFSTMLWCIMTPRLSVAWDGDELSYLPGMPQNPHLEDDLDKLWLTYYEATFNPARIKLKAMHREMPVRYWNTMPETALLPKLLAEADDRVQAMVDLGRVQAKPQVPDTENLAVLNGALRQCQSCQWACRATQTVCGEGDPDAPIMIIGEQPGDCEDQSGRPFVGPAGQLLRELLEDISLTHGHGYGEFEGEFETAGKFYFTNAVKHFQFDHNGQGGRIHKRPKEADIAACHDWLATEISIIKPSVIICLGASAGRAIWGRKVRLLTERGSLRQTSYCRKTLLTLHPAAILRCQDPGRRQQMLATLKADLHLALSTHESS